MYKKGSTPRVLGQVRTFSEQKPERQNYINIPWNITWSSLVKYFTKVYTSVDVRKVTRISLTP